MLACKLESIRVLFEGQLHWHAGRMEEENVCFMLIQPLEEMDYVQLSYDDIYAHLFVKFQGIHLTKQKKEEYDNMPVS